MAYFPGRDIKDASVPPHKLGVTIYNDSGTILSPGDLVYVSGWTTTADGLARIRKVASADADAGNPSNRATYVAIHTISVGGYGTVARAAIVRGLNTNGVTTAGDPVYLHTTAKGFTATAPTAANASVQRVGYAVTKDATDGIVAFDLEAEPESLSNSALQDGSVAGSKAAIAAVKAGAGAFIASEMALAGRIVIDVPDAASGNIDLTALPFKILVTDVTYIKQGGAGNAGNSIVVHNGTTGNAITDALNSATDTAVVRAGTLDDAFTAIAAAATIRLVTVRAGGNNAARIVIDYIRVA